MSKLRCRLRLLLPVVAALGAAFSLGVPAHAATAPAGFPVAVAAANGTVVIRQRPSRVISLSASATQDLYAVGAGAQVVAVDSYSLYPKSAPRTKLSGYTPNLEAIAGYRPDLVVISNDMNHIVARLGRLRIPVLLEPAAAGLDDAYAEIEQIAQATGHTTEAKQVVARMKRQVSAIVGSVPRPSKPLSVYHELDQTYYSATSHTFIGQMYTLLGIQNIADRAGVAGDYPQLSGEYIVAANPDLIVLTDAGCCGQSRATVSARPGWSTIAAVKTGEIVNVDPALASEWGPRVVLFLKAVASAARTLEAQSK